MSDNLNKVPYFTTFLSGPLPQIERHLLSCQATIETWLQEQLRIAPSLIYCSVDLRNAGFKMAPVDTNLFPAGFNNLNSDSLPICMNAIQSIMAETCPHAKEVLLIPEEHTRNMHYYENLAVIHELFARSGFGIQIGTLLADLRQPKTIELPSGRQITLHPLARQGNGVAIDPFYPDLIVLNNDLSAGVPEILQGLDQRIVPSLSLGWHTRLKSTHFKHYQTVAADFAEHVGMDPWLIAPLFKYCGEVDFMAKGGEHCLVDQADDLLQAIAKKYREHNIERKPFLVVKADAGTYGMAVMMIQDAHALRHLNRKERTRMANIKGGRAVKQVIMQEGIYTCESWGTSQSSAEPVIYMIGKQVVGGFYRIHASKGIDENLSAPGMSFQPLALTPAPAPASRRDYSYAYGVVARLALLAATRELEEIESSTKEEA